jgi:hypothetical protein
MSQAPIAAPRTEGRTLGKDWTIANVVRLLRSNAERGAWDSASAASGDAAEVNRYYLRKVSARHLPTNVSVIFMRLKQENCWYASLCFTGGDSYFPWNERIADHWLSALFGDDRSRLRVEDAGNPSVRQFILPT